MFFWFISNIVKFWHFRAFKRKHFKSEFFPNLDFKINWKEFNVSVSSAFLSMSLYSYIWYNISTYRHCTMYIVHTLIVFCVSYMMVVYRKSANRNFGLKRAFFINTLITHRNKKCGGYTGNSSKSRPEGKKWLVTHQREIQTIGDHKSVENENTIWKRA